MTKKVGTSADVPKWQRIDVKDLRGLATLGAEIEARCQGCHHASKVHSQMVLQSVKRKLTGPAKWDYVKSGLSYSLDSAGIIMKCSKCGKYQPRLVPFQELFPEDDCIDESPFRF